MLQIGARADVHVQARDAQPMMVGQPQAFGEFGVPDAVLRMLAAGVGLLAMAVAKARIEPQRDVAPRRQRGPIDRSCRASRS